MESPVVLPDSDPGSDPDARVHAATQPVLQEVTNDWWAVCLCAGWCGTCRDYRPLFEALAPAHPGVRFEWLDIEDEADIAGELDVETFPTVLIGQGASVRFLGPLLPQAPVLGRLLSSLQAAPPSRPGGVDAEVQRVFDRVRAARPR